MCEKCPNRKYLEIFHAVYIITNTQSSPAIWNSEVTEQKVQDSMIFEVARLRDSEITPGKNSSEILRIR